MASENNYSPEVHVDRHVGIQVVDPSSSELLQNGQQTFLGRKEAPLHDEVSPREQDETCVRETNDQLLVATCQPEQPEPISTENTEYGGVLSSMHIAEESQVVESQLLPTSGYGEENEHASKTWVMNKIDASNKSLKEQMQEKIDVLSQQIQQRTAELEAKQKQLNECLTELQRYKRKVSPPVLSPIRSGLFLSLSDSQPPQEEGQRFTIISSPPPSLNGSTHTQGFYRYDELSEYDGRQESDSSED